MNSFYLAPASMRRPVRLLTALLVVVLSLGISGYSAPGANPTTGDSDRVTEAEAATLRATSPPTLTARAAALVDLDTGRVLWSRNGNARLPMASTTKMMTALLASELAEPEEQTTVRPRNLVSGSSIYLQNGERISVEQLLYGALIQSGNDAAVTLADYIGREYLGGVGDEGVDVFVDAMNERATRMGLRNTHFENPNGFDEAGHYSSAMDLARLGREVLADPLLAGIVATAQYKVRGDVSSGQDRSPVYHAVETTNELLGTYRGANGIKTGTTPDAGEVLVASAERGDSGLVAVVLGATDRFSDARALFDWGFASYEWLRLAPAVFSSPIGAAAPATTPFAAVASWNTDLTFYNPAAPARYWAATEPLDVALIRPGPPR